MQNCSISGLPGSWNDSEKYNIYQEKSLIVSLYKAIVRPHLEYCMEAVSLEAHRSICLTITKESSSKLIPGLRNLSCGEILTECGLTSYNTGDSMIERNQIEVFNIILLNGLDNIYSP